MGTDVGNIACEASSMMWSDSTYMSAVLPNTRDKMQKQKQNAKAGYKSKKRHCHRSRDIISPSMSLLFRGNMWAFRSTTFWFGSDVNVPLLGLLFLLLSAQCFGRLLRPSLPALTALCSILSFDTQRLLIRTHPGGKLLIFSHKRRISKGTPKVPVSILGIRNGDDERLSFYARLWSGLHPM